MFAASIHVAFIARGVNMSPVMFNPAEATFVKRSIRFALGIIAVFLVTPGIALAASSSQCESTAWQKSNGRTCASIGLDTRRATCRAQDEFAMFCDDSSTRIRTCASDERCPKAEAVSCPGALKRAHGERGCDAYVRGYGLGKRDAGDRKRGDYTRHAGDFGGAEEPFKQGYNAGYARFK